jgi:hypothetical protein
MAPARLEEAPLFLLGLPAIAATMVYVVDELLGRRRVYLWDWSGRFGNKQDRNTILERGSLLMLQRHPRMIAGDVVQLVLFFGVLIALCATPLVLTLVTGREILSYWLDTDMQIPDVNLLAIFIALLTAGLGLALLRPENKIAIDTERRAIVFGSFLGKRPRRVYLEVPFDSVRDLEVVKARDCRFFRTIVEPIASWELNFRDNRSGAWVGILRSYLRQKVVDVAERVASVVGVSAVVRDEDFAPPRAPDPLNPGEREETSHVPPFLVRQEGGGARSLLRVVGWVGIGILTLNSVVALMRPRESYVALIVFGLFWLAIVGYSGRRRRATNIHRLFR